MAVQVNPYLSLLAESLVCFVIQEVFVAEGLECINGLSLT